jgi:hypothetical protein
MVADARLIAAMVKNLNNNESIELKVFIETGNRQPLWQAVIPQVLCY